MKMMKSKNNLQNPEQKGMQKFIRNFKKNWQLHLMILFPLVYIILFEYAPMFGIQIAFRDFSPRGGIWGSEWVGLANFQRFFKNYKWSQYLGNTIKISMYSIFAGFPVPIILALMLHVNEHPVLKKITQNISYIPHFISVVVMVGILNQLLDPFSGLWGTICQMLNVQAPDIKAIPEAFIHMYVWSGVWQNMGWNTIIYLSALSAVSPELHEAAKLDGAGRFKRVIHVDIPAIMPMIALMLILRFGSVMSVGYEKVYLMQNSLNLKYSEVISTYVYKYGIGKNDLSYGTAVGLMNSLINVTMLLLVNWIANKVSDGEAGMF